MNRVHEKQDAKVKIQNIHENQKLIKLDKEKMNKLRDIPKAAAGGIEDHFGLQYNTPLSGAEKNLL